MNKRGGRSLALLKFFRLRPAQLLRGGSHGVNLVGAIALSLSAVGIGLASSPAWSASGGGRAHPWELLSHQAEANAGAPLPFSVNSAAAAIAQTPVPPTPVAPTPEVSPVTTIEAELEAPSVVWLIVMPAVPIVGGTAIYLSRRLFGGQGGECRLITEVVPPDPSSSPEALPQEPLSQDDESLD